MESDGPGFESRFYPLTAAELEQAMTNPEPQLPHLCNGVTVTLGCLEGSEVTALGRLQIALQTQGVFGTAPQQQPTSALTFGGAIS